MAIYYEAGRHTGKIVKHGFSKANTGTAQFYLTARIMADDNGKPHANQYERTIYRPLTEKTMPYLVEMLDQLHFKGFSLSQLDPGHSQHVSMAGQTIELWCKHENDQEGILRERWQLSMTRNSAQITPISADEAKQLDGMFTQAKAAKGRQIEDGTYITDHDIPF